MRGQPSASIETLLAKEGCTVDDLLDDDDIIQEFRNGNEKLLNYFKRDKLKELIDFITVMPDEDDQKRGHKFPFLVNEIFSLDNQKLNEKFFNIEVIEEKSDSKPEESSDDGEKIDHDDEETGDKDHSSEEEDKEDHHRDEKPLDIELESLKLEEPTEPKQEEIHPHQEIKADEILEEVKVEEIQHNDEKPHTDEKVVIEENKEIVEVEKVDPVVEVPHSNPEIEAHQAHEEIKHAEQP